MGHGTPEGKVKAAIKKMFTDHGVWYCMPMGQAFGRRGVPDFIACVRGVFLAVEAKAKGGKPSKLQLLEMQKILDIGGIALIIYPDNIQYLEDVLWMIETSGEESSTSQPKEE